MLRINHWNAITFACIVFCSISNAQAAQWPVNAGPVHQAVPQYLPRYPLNAPTKPKATPKLEFKQVVPSTSKNTNQPLELLSPEPVKAIPEPLPRRQPMIETAPTVPTRLELAPPKAELPAVPKVKKPTPKKELTKKKSAAKKKQERQHVPTVNYDVYRDRNPLPIDPRKPCGVCTNPRDGGGCGCGKGCGACCDAPGLNGKPYQEREPGGCRCGDKKCGNCSSMFSAKWPRPFSAKLDEHFPEQAADRYCPCQEKRIVDVFDKFTNFKLIDYQRKDNGYCGKGADPYGCLGESRMIASGVPGVGYRFPSVPVDRSATLESADTNWNWNWR